MTTHPSIRCGLFLASALFGAIPAVSAADFQEDVHYERITPPQPTASGDKIEVLEIFWYGCPHCYDFEPYSEEWLKHKAADVEFRRLPGVFRDSWVPHARAYYTAEALGKVETIHPALFKAIHVDHRQIADEKSLAEFFSEQGVSAKEFAETYGSFAIDAKVRQAATSAAAYGISGVPAVIVNGKYRTSGSLAGNYETLLKIIDYLVDTERQAALERH